jgi:glycosyltransferase involved in cell wall biosynthesis
MLSVVILARNEEGNIEECLKTLTWADEILVINDESSDKTSEIAAKLGAKVIKHPLNNDFSAQRNFGLEKASGPARNASQSDAGGEWVLFVDADERVSEKLKKEIEKVVSDEKTKLDGITGFYLKREDTIFGRRLKHGETAGIKLLRLARKSAGKWEGRVHETWRTVGKTGELETPLEHYPHPTISEFLEKINEYSTLRAQELYEQGIRTNLFLIIAYTKGKFLQNYFCKLGFLDGMPGFIVSLHMSFHSFLVRSKLYLLWKQQGLPNIKNQ